MGKKMAYSVYTPPNWQPEERLPLLLLLHGARDDETTFDRYQVGEFLDSQINGALLPRVIVLSPDGGLGFWENWHDGSRLYRDWVIKDLLPNVQARYNTLGCPQHCFATGMSMGGHGAIRFAYYQPGVFSSVAAISAPIISKQEAQAAPSLRTFFIRLIVPVKKIWGDLDGDHLPEDLDPYISWVEKKALKNVRLMLAWGDKESDRIIESNKRFSAHLGQHGRAHQALQFSGGHAWSFWKPVIAESIKFHLTQKPLAEQPAHNGL
ncbi:MAG: carbohydrate esterase [Cellvibrionaceae bacterium]|nr:carbohydrate esterase [Cellvibrionaceae bacterium]